MSVPLSQTRGRERSPYHPGAFRVEITRTTGIWPRKVFVQWILRKPTSASGYTFNVYRSGSADGPWQQVGVDLQDAYYFLDDNFPSPQDRSEPGLFSMRRTVYYRVTVSHATDGEVETVRPLEADVDRRRRGIIRKLRRDAAVALKKGSGTEVAIIKRKWWGEPCTCKSATGVSTRSHCDACHGTGIVDGYWDPVYGYATRSAAPVEVQTTSKGNTETHFLRVKMLYIPEVIPKDVLVFTRDNKRYVVERVVTTEIHTQTVHQELDVSELGRSAVEYDVTADSWHTPAWF